MQQVVAASCVKQSKDYKSFTRLVGNRDKGPAHLKALRTSIAARPDLLPVKPILVNEKRQIIDGQHRHQICQEQGLPVYFVEGKGLTLEDAQLINQQQKNWTPLDFAKSFVELGNENYQTYIDAFKKFHFNHEILMRFLSGGAMSTESFKAGLFTVPNVEVGFEQLQQLEDMKPFYDRYKIRTFAFGFHQICTSVDYDHNQMIRKLRKYGRTMLRDWGKPEQYARMLEDIFIAGQRSGNRPRLFGNTNIKLIGLAPVGAS